MVCPFLLVPQMFSLATRLLIEYSVMSIQTYRGVLYLQNVITLSRYEHAYNPHFACSRMGRYGRPCVRFLMQH